MTSLPARFWDRVNRTDTCWQWTGHVTANGYGKMSLGGRVQYVHRLAYEDAHGPIAAGLVIDHKCHVKRCVRLEHLHAVTNSQNMQNRAGAAANSRSGVRGVYWAPTEGKWRVQIRAKGRNRSGGYFIDLEEAAVAAGQLRASLMENSLRDPQSA